MKTPAQYQADRRERLKAKGWHPVQLWVTPEEEKVLRTALVNIRKYGSAKGKTKSSVDFGKLGKSKAKE